MFYMFIDKKYGLKILIILLPLKYPFFIKLPRYDKKTD